MAQIGKLTRINRRVCWGAGISETQRVLWYARIDAIQRGTSRLKTYRHHPLEERGTFLPTRRL